MFTVPMFNERIIKTVNKHKVINDDKPLPYQICSIIVLRLILGQLSSYTTTFYVIDKVVSEYPFMVVYACKKCGELNSVLSCSEFLLFQKPDVIWLVANSRFDQTDAII